MSSFIAWFGFAESLGIFSLGVNAAILAHAKGYSPLGVVLVTAASAMGGSTVRDLLLGPAALPFVWAKAPALLLGTLMFSLAYALARPVRAAIARRNLVTKEAAETLAIASLTALGAAKATTLLAPVVPAAEWNGLALPMLASVVGMIGGSSGLILRDLLLGEPPSPLAAGAGLLEPILAGALCCSAMLAFGVERPWAVLCGFLLAFALRVPLVMQRYASTVARSA
jgi:uncharacterized membrane protein YeiH